MNNKPSFFSHLMTPMTELKFLKPFCAFIGYPKTFQDMLTPFLKCRFKVEKLEEAVDFL